MGLTGCRYPVIFQMKRDYVYSFKLKNGLMMKTFLSQFSNIISWFIFNNFFLYRMVKTLFVCIILYELEDILHTPNPLQPSKIHGTALVGDLSYHIRLHNNEPPMEARLIWKEILPMSTLPMIQWRGFVRAKSPLKAAQKVPYVKALHNIWPTADKIAGCYDEMEIMRLRCKGGNESVDHVFSCKSQHAAVAFKQAIQKFRKTLSRYKTVPIIVTHLVGILWSHRVR